MSEVRLDGRFPIHPTILALTPGAFRTLIEVLCWLAEHPGMDYIPTRFVAMRGAKELESAQLLTQDGAVWRLESTQTGVNPWRIVTQTGVKDVSGGGMGGADLALRSGSSASKPESTKALALEGKLLGDFERFWNAFGLKVDRRKAQIAFAKAIKTTDPRVIIAAAQSHKEWFENFPGEAPKRKYAQGWLTARRWEDVLPDYPNPNGRPREGRGAALMREAAEEMTQ